MSCIGSSSSCGWKTTMDPRSASSPSSSSASMPCPSLSTCVKRNGKGMGSGLTTAAVAAVALLLVMGCSLLPGIVMAQDDFCYPSDYDRVSSACDATTNTRQVRYEAKRNCTPAFPVQPVHDEPCDCTPEDYTVTYAQNAETGKCTMYYVPKDGCSGGITSTPFEVDEIYCVLDRTPCTAEHIRTAYSQCLYGHKGRENITAPAVEVIYYFDSSCNPLAKGSIRLPPNTFMSCDTLCGAGSYLQGETCKRCPAGTYSMGGALRFDTFYDIDPQYFSASCTYVNATGKQTCDGWFVEDGRLKVGAFDGPNDWFQDECDTDPAYDCHNNLVAKLAMSVKLVRQGFVKFHYTVSAERGFDGLSFLIDVAEKPTMPLQSAQFTAKEVGFNLSEGYHTLTWIFSKDDKWTKGTDTASIAKLEIDGVDFNDRTCTPCPPGYHSMEGARECIPCSLNTYSDVEGATECRACPDGYYSLGNPKTNCTKREACNLEADASFTYSPCVAKSNERIKTWHWLSPMICEPIQPLPEPLVEACPLCPAGQQEKITSDGYKVCEVCPPGTARKVDVAMDEVQDKCEACPQGTLAMKQFSLSHMHLSNGKELPPGFTTGCVGDGCATDGWRVWQGTLESGGKHGKRAEVWLKLNVTVDMDGSVEFNYTADIPPGDTRRGFFFYIDENLVDALEDGGEVGGDPLLHQPLLSGPAELVKGTHELMWKWVKSDAEIPAQRDSVVIFDITVKGVQDGGSAACEEVPEGTAVEANGLTWTPCPPGTFSEGHGKNCTNCPANTFNPMPFGGPWACQQCGEGTTALEGSSRCTIGDVYIPSSFCTYSPPPADYNVSRITVYDLAPLSRVHPGRMFGPIYDNPAAKRRGEGVQYFVAVCDDDITNTTCLDFDGKPLKTQACRVNPRSEVDPTKRRPAFSLGETLTMARLGDHPALERRGFTMMMMGDRCPYTQMERTTNITFICDPNAGAGTPEAWTMQGKAVAFDPSIQFPGWVLREGPVIPIASNDSCDYSMVWYTSYACPMCTYEDYELVEVYGCRDNKYITYKYKEPKTCQANEQQPLPNDIPCQPCTKDDYERVEGNCADVDGRHNVTFRWNVPKVCNNALEGAAQLPESTVVGACVRTVYVVSDDLLSPKYIVLMVLGSVLVVVLAVVSIVNWIRSRRIYAMYSKLVEGGPGGDGEDGLDDNEFEQRAGAERRGEGDRLAPEGSTSSEKDDGVGHAM